MRIHTKGNTTSPEDTPPSSSAECYGPLVERVTHFGSVPVEKTLAIERLSVFDERKKSLINQKIPLFVRYWDYYGEGVGNMKK